MTDQQTVKLSELLKYNLQSVRGYRHASPPTGQLQALARRNLMRRARSSQKRPLLLAELEARYKNSS